MSIRNTRLLAIAMSVVSLAACVAPIQPYEGPSAVRVGQGGAREQYEGIDVWTHGDPPVPYQMIGYTTVQADEGWIGHGVLLARIARRVREVRGSAALIGNTSAHVELSLQKAGNMRIPENVVTVEITIVRYM